jgi:cbb3-type cytochrome oxidase subunit 3
LAYHFHDSSGHPDYAKALGLFVLVIFVVLIFLAAIGPEKRGKEF